MSRNDQSATGSVSVDVSAADQEFGRTTRGFFVGGAGDLAVTMKEGNNQTFAGVAAGTVLPIQATAALNTGTTATNVVALF